MAERVQISCEKQGRNDTSSWSTRILTMDRATSTLIISRHHHPNNVFYHAVQVREVQLWPHFKASLIDDSIESTHAKRTVYILGREVPVPHFAHDAVPGHDESPLSLAPSADATSDTSSSSATPYTFMAGDASKRSRPLETGGYDSWLLRFTTQDAYELAVAMLQNMPHVHVVTGHRTEMEAATAPLMSGPIIAPVGPI